MHIVRVNGSTSNVLRATLRNSSTGAGLTGLTSASSGLIVSTIADNEASATAYTVTGSTIETITTLGTFAAPTATKCRFKEVDSTNHPGLYEIQIADARFAVSSAKVLRVCISGATNLLAKDIVIQQSAANIDDAVRMGMSALPNVASGSAGAVITSGTGTAQLSVSSGQVILQSGTGTGQLDFTSGVVKANAVQLLGTAWLTPGTAGTPDVNMKLAGGTAVTLDANNTLNVSAKYWAGTAITSTSIPVATAAGSAGGLFIAGTNAATTITTALTTTFTGNLTGNVGGNVAGSTNSVTTAVTLSAADGQAWATGTATAGGATSITLQTALGADTLAVGSLIKITSGTGSGQTRVITAYVNGTKVVTVGRAWVTNPDNTSVYAILYSDVPKIDSSLKISGVALADTITTYTGNTVQTGDSYARIGSTGSGLTSLAPSATALSTAQWSNTLATNLTTLASHDPGTTIGTSTLTAANVWDLATSGHTTSGTFGAAAVAAGGAGDPWSTSLPGSYGAGTAGYIIGNNINATISSRQATFTSGTSISFPTNFGSLAITAGGIASADLQTIKTQTVTCAAGVTVLASVGTATTDTAQTGDSYARIGATGSGLTSLAPSSTALSTATWTGTRAGYLDNLSGGAVALASGVAVTSLGAGVITASSIAADAITAAKIADGAIDTATFAAGTTIPRVTLADTATTLTNLPAVTTDWLTAAGVSAAGAAKIADVTLRRTMAHVFASSDGDAVTKNSLYGSIQQMQKSSVSSTTMTILNTDGSTLGTLTVTASAGADPITGVS